MIREPTYRSCPATAGGDVRVSAYASRQRLPAYGSASTSTLQRADMLYT